MDIISIGFSLFGLVKNVMSGSFTKAAVGIVDRLAAGKISAEEAKAEIAKAESDAWARGQEASAKAASEMFAAAQETIQASFKSPDWFTRNAWAFVLISQTFVLLWYQLGVPWITYLKGLDKFPTTGDPLLYWANGIVLACLGIAQVKQNGLPKLPKLFGKQ